MASYLEKFGNWETIEKEKVGALEGPIQQEKNY